jgi:hypothetical protein
MLAFVNCGKSWDTIHCEAIQYRGSIFYLTTREEIYRIPVFIPSLTYRYRYCKSRQKLRLL